MIANGASYSTAMDLIVLAHS